MTSLSDRIAGLSPEKQALLLMRLQEKKTKKEQLSPRPDLKEHPLSYAQQRLWFLDQLQPNTPLYNIPGALHLRGNLDIEILQKSIHQILQRHEPLRANFLEVQGEPVQFINQDVSLEIPVIDLQSLSAAEREKEVARLAEEEGKRPFHLSHDPLFRATLLKCQPDEHILLLTVHHIAFDGWSTGIFIEEIATIYHALLHDQRPYLPELPIQYADFAHWQQAWLDGGVLSEQQTYWVNQLGDQPPVLELPTDFARPPVLSDQGAHYQLELPRQLTSELKDLANETKTTLFMLLLAAFNTLLFRYAHQDDICIGIPTANRNRSEIEKLIGFFVNTLVIRTDLSQSPSFLELLYQVRDTTLAAQSNQDIPFEMLVDQLRPNRNMSHMPLFQVMFDLQKAPLTGLQLSGININRLPIETGISKFDLMLIVTETDTNLIAEFEFSTDLFKHETIARMANHLQLLLTGIVANPNQSIDLLPLLTEAERRQIVVDWNDTAVPYSHDQCVHQLVEAQAIKTPDATAVAFGDERITYRELNGRANQLAHYLQKLGVSPGSFVGVCLERSADLIVALLSILKAGGAYVPLDPTYPPDRLAFMISDAQTLVVLTQSHIAPNLPQEPSQLLLLDTAETVLAHEPSTNPSTQTKSHNLAYVIYTSGSTGQPKGVLIGHQSLLNLIFWTQRTFAVSEVDKVTQIAGPGFDASVWEIWPYLTAGASIYIPNDETRASPEQLRDWLLTNNITISFLPTPLAENIIALKWPSQSALRLLHTGGDRLHRHPSSEHPFTLVNNYGPTEDTVVTTSGIVPTHKQSNTPPTIGRPIDNTQLYILDEHLQPVAIGISGELHIGGDGLAQGYLNRPNLTAKKFIQNPFTPKPGARLYKTGDLVRYRSDGEIEFLGRIDDQVKIRGFRIELGEIQAKLNQHPDISESVLMVHGLNTNDKFIVAYLVSENPALETPEVRQFLKKELPEYMIPATCVVLDALPLTANGKIDRKALPVPNWTQPDREYVAPRNTTEEILAGIWSQILSVEKISIYDNFFELGGHSLLATQIASRIKKQFLVDLPLRVLFEATTIAALAQHVTQLNGQANEKPIERLPEGAKRPLSSAQQRLWFLEHLEQGSAMYNIADAVCISGELNIDALQESLNDIFQRHETLRSTFATDEDGQPVLTILPELTLDLPVQDLQPFTPDERDSFLQRAIISEAMYPFNLSRPPLLRFKLFKTAVNEHIILINMHHIISDGWSIGVFMNELATLYATHTGQSDKSLPPLPIQYSDYAHWQREWLQGDPLKQQLAYWKEELADTPALLELPTDHPRPSVQRYQGKKMSFKLPTTLSQQVKQLSQKEEATLFMTLLAAFQVLLFRYTNQKTINVGTPIANRNRHDIEGLIGFFINTLVMRGDLSNLPTFRELLCRTRQTALNAFANQDVPFEMIVDAVQPERNLSHSPLFQVMFALQNVPAHPLELPGVTLTSLDVDCGISNFDLTLVLAESDDGLAGNFEYNTDLFEASTIQRMIGHFQTLVSAIVDNPDQTIDQLTLLTEAEQQQILVKWNETATTLPENQCIHHLIATAAANTPTAIAIEDGLRQITYETLNQRANQLAHALQQRGIAPGDCVGISVNRSAEMIIGMLGILKAGAAYLPLDPTYPAERLQFMIQDAQPKVVLVGEAVSSQLSAVSRENNKQKTENGKQKTTPHSPFTIHHLPFIILSSDWSQFALYPTTNPSTSQSPDSLAYIIYTSGSTGTPKGVMVSHLGLLNHNLAILDLYRLRPSDRAWQFATINFDTAVEEIFPTLISGATLVLRDETVPPVNELCQLAASQQLTVLNLPTAYWHEWVNELALTGKPVPNCVRFVVVGGEKASAAHLQQWQTVVKGTAVTWMNTYGPTEATVIATTYEPEGPLNGEIPIGHPINNTQAYVLDPQQQPVPIGVPGELYIGGVGVAQGYLNRPELTAERFITFSVIRQWTTINGQPSTDNHQRTTVYRTGDLVRWLHDGNLEFLGRVDDQVKIRGFRIEPGEIEAVLRQHPHVQETAVLAREDTPGSKRIVAYIVPNQKSPTVTELREFLNERLPAYMIPSAFVTLDQMPLMLNAKINRTALPAPNQQRPELEADFVAPQTAKEQTLVEIWQTVLGLDQIGIHDNFFELGGDSILTIQLVARAHRAGLSLTARDIFQYPTIAALAAVAETAVQIEAEQGIVTGDVPLTPIQHWFFDQSFADPHHWNQSLMLQVREELDINILETAVSHLLQHHDALRLRYTPTDSGIQQNNIAAEAVTVMDCRDLANFPERTQRELLTAAANQLQANLNLENGPLVRLRYFNMGPNRLSYLLIVIHHLVIDGISWRILLEDLQLVYQQLSQNQPVQLPDKTTSFQQWANKLTAFAHSETMQEEAFYWRELVEGKRPFSLPHDFPQISTTNLVKDAQNVTVNLNQDETEALLRDVPSVYGTEINDILLTALVESFSHFTYRRDLWIALEGHGREEILEGMDLSRTVGWFTTVFPVYINLQHAHSPGDAIKQTKEQLNAVPNRGIGFGILRYLDHEFPIKQILQAMPEPEVSFNYLGQFDQNMTDLKFALSRESTGSPHSPNAHRTHLLDINGGISNGELRFEWTYGSQIYLAETIQTLANGFMDALRSLITHCQDPEAGGYTPSDFPDADLSEDDLEALLLEVGD